LNFDLKTVRNYDGRISYRHEEMTQITRDKSMQ